MKSSSAAIKVLAIVAVTAALAGDFGCTKMTKPSKIFSLESTWPFRDKDAPREGTPTRMACTWTDTVKTEPGKKAERGFGGRIMFYEKEANKPILVDGELVVYAFDETGREPTDTKPTRRYVFPADQVPLHMSKNEFGASYSFYLPWDEAGGPRTDVSLICRFKPKDGSVVTSEQTTQKLGGALPQLTADGKHQPPKLPEGVPAKPIKQTLQSLQAQRNEDHRAQLASYDATAPIDPQAAPTDAAADAAEPRKMSSTTINLPNNFQMPSATPMTAPPAAAMQTAPQMVQPAPAQPLPQHETRVYQVPGTAATPAKAVQQAAYNRPFTAGQPMLPTSAVMSPVVYSQPGVAAAGAGQASQPINAQGAYISGSFQPALVANGQSAPNSLPGMSQLQAQPTTLQQQLVQQRLMQQKALQQRALPQSPVPQAPVQTGLPTASYPPVGQSVR